MTNSFSLNIKKGQGLTQALQSYVKSNKDYDISGGVDKTQWNATIAELGKIQEERKANNKNSIFTGGSENGNWNKNMQTKEGQVDFSEDEMNRLLSKMGVKNKKFDNWCTDCAKSIDIENSTKDKDVYTHDVKDFDMVGDEFRNDINKNGGKNAQQIYKTKALKTADDEIALYDKDGDGKIDINEMKAKDGKIDLAELSEKDRKDYEAQFGASDAQMQEMHEFTSENTLKYIDLNGDGKIDNKEYAAYLNAMDSNNDKTLSDGRITRDEFSRTGEYANDYAIGKYKEKKHEKQTKSEIEAGSFRGRMLGYFKNLFGSEPAEKK